MIDDNSGNEVLRSGFVALVGRPNVGKSTLLNRLVGTKISIVSHKPQTTRHRILGIRTVGESQIAYVDTPGLHRRAGKALNRQMNRAATSTLDDVDLVLWLVESGRFTKDDRMVEKALTKASVPVFVAINKVDLTTDKSQLLPFAKEITERSGSEHLFMISARDGSGVDDLESALLQAMPEGPALYEKDRLTDRGERFLIAELIREQVTRRLHQELPYAANVEVESIEREPAGVRVGAVIWVERESQKGIAIGKGGQSLKAIGTSARKSIERLLESRVHLDLWVKVKSGWTDDDRQLKDWGLTET